MHLFSTNSSRWFFRDAGAPVRRWCITLLATVLLSVVMPTLRLVAQTATHTVQPGETLSQIAGQYGTTEAALMALNDLDEPDTILAGQQLVVPAPATFATPPPGQHRVQVGETLSEIAKAYDVSLAQLMAANGIDDADNVYSGQLLAIPVAALSQELAAPEPSLAATPESTPALERQETYTVAPGDTLTAIARRFELDVAVLRTLNGLDDADTILVGQTLRLMAAPTSDATSNAVSDVTPDATAAVEEATASPADTIGAVVPAPIVDAPIERSGNPIGSLNRTYQVRVGDTLGLIALRTGVDADALRRLNRFSSLNAALNAGQQLLLPAAGDELRPRRPAREYQVKPGETLSQIAADHGITLGVLLQANRIANPNTVYPGQSLLIPSVAESSASTDARPQIGPPRSGYFYYTVQPGDTMSEIARNLNTTMLAIQTYNDLPDSETVYNNMELKIPYGPPPLTLAKPPVPASGTRFIVSLSRQQCWVYQGDRLRYAWSCS